MLHRTMLLSLITGLSLLSAPIAQSMSWDFWTRNHYKNTWIMGASVAGAGFLYYLWQQANRSETPEECYVRVQNTLNSLCHKYDDKIVAFERGYAITGNDITSKNQQFEVASVQWQAHIDEEALSHLGSFPGNWRTNLSIDVKQLSGAKIDLSKMRRLCLQENKNLLLAKKIEKLFENVSLFFLQLSFLKDCVKHNEAYLDFLVNERALAKNYAYVVNISATQANLKQIICKNSTEKSHQYVKFIQSLSKDIENLSQKINQTSDAVQNTKLFRRAEQLHNMLRAIEKRIYADKTLHNDLHAYQADLLKHMEKNVRKLYSVIKKAQTEADNVRGLEGRLSVVIAAYSAYRLLGNQQNNTISSWEMDDLRSISKGIEKIVAEIKKARDYARSSMKEMMRMQAQFDEANISVAEQLRLQGQVEKTIQDTESTVKTIQNAEQRARKAADDLHSWARKNNLFLV